MELKIEYLNKEQLKPYVNNAKIHTADQVEQIKNSIREFGFNDPIAVWHDNEIVEGHGRLLAVMEMDEIKTVPVIRLDDLSDAQRKAYAIAHNKLTMNTDFDLDLLSLELEDLSSFDMTNFGFNEAEIIDLTIDDSPEEIPSVEENDGDTEASDDRFSEFLHQREISSPEQIPTAPITKEELSVYRERAEQLVTRRVIIVYRTDEEETFLKDLFSVDPEKALNVVLDVKAIMKAKEAQENGEN